MNLGFGLGKCCQGYGQNVPCFGEKKVENVQLYKSQEVSKGTEVNAAGDKNG